MANKGVGYAKTVVPSMAVGTTAVTVPSSFVSLLVSSSRVPFCKNMVFDASAALSVDVYVFVWLRLLTTTYTVPKIVGVIAWFQ